MSSLRRAFVHDVEETGLAWDGPGTEADGGNLVTAEEIAELPEPVRRYLAFMEVVGRPRYRSFEARFSGRFRRTPRDRWMAAEAHQYNTAPEVARIYTMRLRFAGLLPMVGHDTYVRGSGRMVGKLFDRFTVADGAGDEFDVGELVTYLNDAILLAPSMLLGPSTTWRGLDDSSFEVALTDASHTVRATITLDARGAPIDFVTVDRFASLPQGLVRATWTTPVSAWVRVDGRMLPGPARATWLLDDGPFTYVEGRFVTESIRYDVPPPRA